MDSEKISDSCLIASRRAVERVANGAAGAGLSRACARSLAACMAASVDERRGTETFVGKKATVLQMRSALVLIMYISQHR